MKKLLVLVLMLAMVLMAVPAFAWDLGYSISGSHYDADTSGVSTHTDSFHAVGILGSGSATGENWAGGQALTTHIYPFGGPLGDTQFGGATQNFGEAIGGFSFEIKTGNKNFLWIIPPMAGALAGTKGDVSQESTNWSHISGFNGTANSNASQDSAAGFVGGDAGLLIGKNKSDTGAFSGDSVVNGYTYSYSYKGIDGNTRFIGTMSGAGNSANTLITGGFGSGYAGGNGQTSGGSFVESTTPGVGSSSGMYAGHFSYSGNGWGNVAGYSQSYGTTLPHGAIFGTSSGVSVNVN